MTNQIQGIPAPEGMTEQQLQATYTREAPHRPHWPRAFATAMADPLIGRTLVLLTRNAVPAYARRSKPRQPEFPQVAPASVFKVMRGPPRDYTLSQKDLAAGEREEKES